MVKYQESHLDDIFFALSDPTRRAILERLAQDGELMVTEVAAPFAMSLPAVSKHIQILARAKLLVQEKDGRIRRCQLTAEPLQTAAAWIVRYRRFWETQFDQLADYLDQVQGETGESGNVRDGGSERRAARPAPDAPE
jgi:DNA-binding transcriptional ArsR family regulator